jgi:ABC-2 type transport system ATP-binding protein
VPVVGTVLTGKLRTRRRGSHKSRVWVMIEIDGLYKYYGEYRALGPLTATIADGEVVGLLGLNGAGKTTTMRILACDLLPSAGTVRVGGVDVVDEPHRVRQMIGYLPDSPPVYDEMTVGEYLTFAARLRQVPASKANAAVTRAAGVTGLQAVTSRRVSELSHGYRQRVGIAQAIVHEPKLVVLDEPSTGLDPIQIKEMRALVRSLGGKHTVLVSSHNLPEITEMCDRLLVIGNGAIVASGTEAELVTRLSTGQMFEVWVTATATWSAPRLVQTLQGIAHVKHVGEGRAPEAGVVAVVVETDRDVRSAIAKTIVENGGELLNLSRSERELENVFAMLAKPRTSDVAS